MTNRRISLKTLALGSCALGALMAGPAAAEQFAVPSQELRTALQQFATQGDQQVLFSSAAVAGKRTAGFSGEASPETALQALLAGTDLVWSKTGDGALLVKTRQEAAADPQSGSAAGDGADSGTVQALIVTAQKREENIQDVPIAMSAFTQEDLTRSQVATGADLMTQVPNMTFTKTNFSSYSIQIRGIGTQAISATTDPAVAVAFNNTPFIRNRFFEQEFYDLQRVEVLRGPQGTLYGRNATAGVVNLISQKPKFTYEAKASADIANYGSHRLEGMANIPLVEDKVALRIAGAWTKRDGFTENEVTGQPIDGRDLWSTRVSLRVAPTDAIEANLIWEHFQEDDDRLRSGKQLCNRDARTEISGVPTYVDPGYYVYPFSQGCLPASLYSPDSFQAPNGLSLPYRYGNANDGTVDTYLSTTQSPDLRVIESTYPPEYRAKSDLLELQASFDVAPGLTLTSETGYNSDFIWSIEDYNRFTARPRTFTQIDTLSPRPGVRITGSDGVVRFCDPQLGCQDHIVAVDLSTAKSRQFSQEFRLASNFDGKFNFSVGANFLRYDTMEKYYVFINSLTMRVTEQITTDGAMMDNPIPYEFPDSADNYGCLQYGMRAPDPNQAYDISCAYIDPNPIGRLNDQGHNYFLSKNPYKLISYALFGETYYNITDELKLTAGLRFGVDKKEAPRIPSWIFAGMTAGYPVANVIKQEWREPTGRLALDWKPQLSFTDQTLIYGSFAHGYKAGGANPPAAGVVLYAHGLPTGPAQVSKFNMQPQTFDPEFVNAFEVGTKNTLLGGRLTLNGDVFYYDYTGYQISQIINRSALNSNLDAKVWGAELEAEWEPVQNLRLGFKGGFEKTRIGSGQGLVDVMDRTAGRSDWIVVRPFPTFPSNCVVPLYTVTGDVGHLTTGPQVFYNGNMGPCEFAYVLGFDPVTSQPYMANPPGLEGSFTGYPGFDPLAGTPGDPYTGQNTFNGHDYGPTPNGGTGFTKDLSGHELPNAPHFTATVTGDYTIPLRSDWLMTLHTDLYYQSEAWTRVFNTPGYDKLKAFTNVNVAAIFSNEDAGWKVMAYVKNVFDKDNITGAFLNSDDTGLTTNVFLVEPRLYGLRVTKDFSGGPWWTGANPNHTEPYPLTVELGGQVHHGYNANASLSPAGAVFPGALNTLDDVSNRNFDTGDGKSLKVTWQPHPGSWAVSAGVRYGRMNKQDTFLHTEVGAERHCLIGPTLDGPCSPTYHNGDYYLGITRQEINFTDDTAGGGESYKIADFQVGREVGLGGPTAHSSASLGLRYAQFDSETHATIRGIPDHFYEGAVLFVPWSVHRYTIQVEADRTFKGLGPTIAWDAATHLLGSDANGHLDIDWSLTGGVLFGRQNTNIVGSQTDAYFHSVAKYSPAPEGAPVTTDISQGSRSRSVTVPTLDATLGLSYEIQRVKIGAGYHWERYFNVLDAGYDEHKNADRTIDGPYFKIAVGFGG